MRTPISLPGFIAWFKGYWWVYTGAFLIVVWLGHSG
jgi:hypothetical protein